MQLSGLQMGQMAISRIETGKRLVADFELKIFAHALGVTMEWLSYTINIQHLLSLVKLLNPRRIHRNVRL